MVYEYLLVIFKPAGLHALVGFYYGIVNNCISDMTCRSIMSANGKIQIQNHLLKVHKDEIVKSFTKYRDFINNKTNATFRETFYQIIKIEILTSLNKYERLDLLNQILIDYRTYLNMEFDDLFRQKFYSILKREVLQSLNEREKLDLFEQIKKEYYENDDITADIYPYDNGPYYDINYSEFEDSVNSTQSNYSELDENSQNFISRSGESTNIDLFANETETDSKDPEAFSGSNEFLITPSTGVIDDNRIKELFEKITDLINNGHEILEELDRMKTEDGINTYCQTMKYIPINSNKCHNKHEPIIFQLASKIDQYESILDRLWKEKLLTFDLQNEYKLCIFNYLLYTSFENLLKFLNFLRARNIKSTIRYIFTNSAEITKKFSALRLTENSPTDRRTSSFENTSSTEVTKEWTYNLKSPLSSYNPGELFLVMNGLSNYKRSLKKLTGDRFTDCAATLNRLGLLHAILNEKIDEEIYIDVLAEKYYKYTFEIEKIIELNHSAIINGRFLVIYARKNLIDFHGFLLRLLKHFKIPSKTVYKKCMEENKSGTSVATVIQNNRNRNYAVAARLIQRFLDKYKNRE